jgi:hypothetical protein
MASAEEERMRRRARQQGLKLLKARPCAHRHPETGTFMLVDATTNEIIVSRDTVTGYGLSLEEVADYFSAAEPPTTSAF